MRALIRKPHLTNEVLGDKERKSSWLELFFDIFFIVAVSSTGHVLANDISAQGLGAFLLSFTAVWWVWIGFVYYNEMHETFGLENRIFTILMMLPVAGMAIGTHEVLSETFYVFALSYAAARLLLSFLYFRAGYHIKSVQKINYSYGIAMLMSAVLTVLCMQFAETSAHYFFVGILCFDLLTPVITYYLIDKELHNSLLEKIITNGTDCG